MFRASRFFALLVLTVWFSATQHCGLASLGWSSSCVVGRPTNPPCSQDGCDQIEKGAYDTQTQIAKAPAPALLAVTPLVAIVSLTAVPVETPVELLPAVVERPRNWVTTWHFVRRAAPPCRAPALLCA